MPILDRGGRWVEGEALAHDLIARLNELGGGHGDTTFDAEVWIARFVSLQGRLNEADAMFLELLARARTLELSPRVRARAHLFHGGNLCRKGAFAESEAELRAAAELLDDFRMGTRDSTPDDVLIEFIALYTAWDKPERVQEYQAMRHETLRLIAPD